MKGTSADILTLTVALLSAAAEGLRTYGQKSSVVDALKASEEALASEHAKATKFPNLQD